MNDSSLVIVFLFLAKKEWHIRRNYNLYSAFVAGIASKPSHNLWRLRTSLQYPSYYA